MQFQRMIILFFSQVFASYLQFCGIGIKNAQLYERSELENKRNQVVISFYCHNDQRYSDEIILVAIFICLPQNFQLPAIYYAWYLIEQAQSPLIRLNRQNKDILCATKINRRWGSKNAGCRPQTAHRLNGRYMLAEWAKQKPMSSFLFDQELKWI